MYIVFAQVPLEIFCLIFNQVVCFLLGELVILYVIGFGEISVTRSALGDISLGFGDVWSADRRLGVRGIEMHDSPTSANRTESGEIPAPKWPGKRGNSQRRLKIRNHRG